MYNSCYQIAVVNTVATTAVVQLPACSTYTVSVNPTGKKRRKRSDLLNNEIRETSDKISPSKVTSVDVLIITAYFHALHRPPNPPWRNRI